MATLSYFRAVMKQLVLIFLGTLLIIKCTGQKVFDFNSTCLQGYQEISKLKLKQGNQFIEKAKHQNSQNLIPLLLESYRDFYTLFLKEDPTEYNILYPQFQQRINQLQEGPTASPFYLYTQALIRVQKAGVLVKFGHVWDAGWEFRRAYLLLKENKKLYPSFTPNNLLYGTLQTVLGTAPKGYKWLINLLGMNGSLTEGMKMVKNFTYSNDPWAITFFNDAAIIYPYLLFFFENKKEEAIAFTQQKKLDIVNNHLHAYMASNLALNIKQIDNCQFIIQHRNKSEAYLKLNVWDFLMGYAKLYHLELTESKQYFEQFTREFKGNFYVKDVYQKLSWIDYLQGNLKKAEENRKLVIKNGSTDADADKKALKDAKAIIWPNTLLLKARLLNDGGYYIDAYKLLEGKTENDFEKVEDKLEFAYRAAKIYDDLNKPEEAIKAYLITIRLGSHRKEYFAARAAVQIAQIYEARGQKKLAILYYQKCLEMEDHDYKDSLDQRAKAGIARCKGE